MTTPELAPCPFCGGEATMQVDEQITVGCTVCGIHLHDTYTTEKTVKDWNTRHSPAKDKLVEALERLDEFDSKSWEIKIKRNVDGDFRCFLGKWHQVGQGYRSGLKGSLAIAILTVIDIARKALTKKEKS